MTVEKERFMSRSTVGVVLAAGKGSRFTGETPKQFALLSNKPVLAYSVDAMQACDAVNAILLVVPADRIETVQSWVQAYRWNKVTAVISGGEQRFDSTRAALAACDAAAFDNILLHDAARPLLSQEVLRNVITALETEPAVTAAVPVTDTVVRADADAFVAETPDRATLWAVQTPQGFHLDTLQEAYRRIDPADLPKFTDDTAVVRHVFPHISVKLVSGDRKLMKLTYPEDLTLLSALL